MIDCKSGDYVVLDHNRCESWNIRGEMDHYLNNVICLTAADKNINTINFYGTSRWSFRYTDIKRYATAQEKRLCQDKDNFNVDISKVKCGRSYSTVSTGKDNVFKEEENISLEDLLSKVDYPDDTFTF